MSNKCVKIQTDAHTHRNMQTYVYVKKTSQLYGFV